MYPELLWLEVKFEVVFFRCYCCCFSVDGEIFVLKISLTFEVRVELTLYVFAIFQTCHIF
jgi:hypothetical protein